MGRLNLEAMLDFTNDFDVALAWHLESNMFPSVHRAFIPACKEAIAAAKAGEWDTEIQLPNGNIVSATEVVDGLHLDSFVDYVEPDGDEDKAL